MRILGLDFGSKTVGVAVSDELMLTAQGLEIVRRQSPNKLRQTLARIEEIVNRISGGAHCAWLSQEYEQYRGRALREDERVCKEMLERRTGLPVVLWDERLTTVCGRPAHDGEWNTQRESQTVCG